MTKMKEILEPASHHETTLRELQEKVEALGGDLDTPLDIESDGEPVYIVAYVMQGESNGSY